MKHSAEINLKTLQAHSVIDQDTDAGHAVFMLMDTGVASLCC